MTDFDENDSINPDLDDLQQDNLANLPAVDVRLTGPALTHELPARVAHSRNINVTDSATPEVIEQVANEDLRRKFLYISVTGFPCFVGFEKQSVIDGTAGILPVGQVLPLPTAAPVYVRAAAVGTAVVSYWAGNWAD